MARQVSSASHEAEPLRARRMTVAFTAGQCRQGAQSRSNRSRPIPRRAHHQRDLHVRSLHALRRFLARTVLIAPGSSMRLVQRNSPQPVSTAAALIPRLAGKTKGGAVESRRFLMTNDPGTGPGRSSRGTGNGSLRRGNLMELVTSTEEKPIPRSGPQATRAPIEVNRVELGSGIGESRWER